MCLRRTLAEFRNLGSTIIAWVYLADVGGERDLCPFRVSRRLRGAGTIPRALRPRWPGLLFLVFLAELKIVVAAVVSSQGRVILLGSNDCRSPASPTPHQLCSNQP